MDPKHIVVVVQARMSSTRLPGKVLAPLAGAPAIVRMLERVRRMTRSARHLVATSGDVSDDPLAEMCRAHGIAVYRGALDDVLGRVAAALPAGAEVVVRLTGDCPLVDPALVDHHLEVYAVQPPGAYVSNAVDRTYPDGLDVEVMSRELIERAAREAADPNDREHVTPWIRRHARHVAITQAVDLSDVRWVLDTPEDLRAIAAIYSALHPRRPGFTSGDIYRLQMSAPHFVRMAGGASVDDAIGRMRALLALPSAEPSAERRWDDAGKGTR